MFLQIGLLLVVQVLLAFSKSTNNEGKIEYDQDSSETLPNYVRSKADDELCEKSEEAKKGKLFETFEKVCMLTVLLIGYQYDPALKIANIFTNNAMALCLG